MKSKFNLYKKLRENGGKYIMNLSDPEEFEYALDKIGGSDYIKTYFPALYSSFVKSAQSNAINGNDDLCNKVAFDSIDLYHDSNDKGTMFGGNILGDLCDITLTEKNLGEAQGKPWLEVAVVSEIYNYYDESEPPFATYSGYIGETSRFESGVETFAEIDKQKVESTTFAMANIIYGIDNENKQRVITISNVYEKKEFGISDIINEISLVDPREKGTGNDPIIMLYGRTADTIKDKKVDYCGGEYLKNAGGDEGDKRMKTLMPLKGTIIFNPGFNFKGLSAPTETFKLFRPRISLDNILLTEFYSNKWDDKRGFDNYKDIYNLIKDCFVQDPKNKQKVYFDIQTSKGSVDWLADVLDAKRFIKDYRCLKYRVTAAFRLDVELPQKGISQIVVSIQYNENVTDYYVCKNGRGEVYIPIVEVHWGCIGKDAVIATDNGNKIISDLCKGDKLLSTTGKYVTVSQIIKSTEKMIYRIETANGSIDLTPGHPVMLADGRIKTARQIDKHDFILMQDCATEVCEVTYCEYNDMVYNFYVEESNAGTYVYANGFAVGDAHAQNAPLPQEKIVYSEEELTLKNEFRTVFEGLSLKNPKIPADFDVR